jgi:predicted transcriptional regulator
MSRPSRAAPSADAAALERQLEEAAEMFAMLSASVRLHLIWLLADGNRDVGTLARETGHTVATVSHHLVRLKHAGFVGSQRNGQRQVYVVNNQNAVDFVRFAIGTRDEHTPATPESVHTGSY